ncbi:MAG: gamma carbonic anhydrase family protein [Syntrophobacteraceae bacterium]
MSGVLAYRDKLPQLGEGVYIAPGAWVIGDVIIGDYSSVWFNAILRGDTHYIRIGSETNIQDNCTFHGTEGEFPTILGDRVTVGHQAILHGCIVEDDCLIGMGAIVMDGARIGKGSFVGAGTLVPPGFVVPPGSVVMGVPATVRRTTNEAEKWLLGRSKEHYLELIEAYSNPDPELAAKRVRGFLG